ncbi:hypothetical protein Efla_000868 [Eimeria flavescens]
MKFVSFKTAHIYKPLSFPFLVLLVHLIGLTGLNDLCWLRRGGPPSGLPLPVSTYAAAAEQGPQQKNASPVFAANEGGRANAKDTQSNPGSPATGNKPKQQQKQQQQQQLQHEQQQQQQQGQQQQPQRQHQLQEQQLQREQQQQQLQEQQHEGQQQHHDEEGLEVGSGGQPTSKKSAAAEEVDGAAAFAARQQQPAKEQQQQQEQQQPQEQQGERGEEWEEKGLNGLGQDAEREEWASSSLRLRDLPPLAFPRPSEELRRLANPLEAPELTAEREQIKKVYPFNVPIQVRSAVTGAKFSFILRSVLGSGGQGIVLLAQDAKSEKAEFALKVFWIQPKRQRGVAKDVERLKRRVHLEVAIAQSAPSDIPLGVWSQLSHIVMPLDVVEPTSSYTPPPEDKTRYWPQWVVFERFAGDLAMLRGLPYSSASAKLSATKQILMAVVRIHDMGMVHSDIKTQNFFVKADGRIFLGDYSLAHPIGHLTACTEGTATYLPPENLQCMRAKERNLKVTPVKDSWALGTVLFRIWCYGSRPFNVDDLLYDELLDKIARARVEDLQFSHCSPDTPLAVLKMHVRLHADRTSKWQCEHSLASFLSDCAKHMIRLLLDPNPERRATPRELFERHPAFTMEKKDLLADTLGGMVFRLSSKGPRLP